MSTNPTVIPQGSNVITFDEIRAIAAQAAVPMSEAMSKEARSSKLKDEGGTFREKAAEHLFPAFERMGIPPGLGKAFTETVKDDPYFAAMRDAVCRELSNTVRDEVVDKDDRHGNPRPAVFSGRVKKAWSRLVTSYREDGKGGQTEADKLARAAEKARKELAFAKASVLDLLIASQAAGNTDAVEGALAGALERWPVA